ncbi:MAG: DMT family transporter [Paracoccaceae bacterium]
MLKDPMSQESAPRLYNRPLKGISLKVGSVIAFIVMYAMIKATTQTVPPGEATFFRSFFALPVIVAWLATRRELGSGLKVTNPFGHLWRGVMGTGAMASGFAGLIWLPLPEVTALGYAGPLLTVIFAAMFLGEEVRAFRLTAVALGLCGVLLVLSPRLTMLQGGAGHAQALGATIVLTGAVFSALAQVTVRRLVATETTSSIVFWFSVTATCLSLITLPFGWVVPTGGEAVLLVGAGLLGGVGQILLTSSYREADASLVAPFDYSSMLFALLLGWFVFGDAPTPTMLAGAALVIAAGVAIILRERQLGLVQARARKSMTPQG